MTTNTSVISPARRNYRDPSENTSMDVEADSRTAAIHLQKYGVDSLPCPLVQAIRSPPRHLLFGKFGCRELAPLTLPTSLTADVDSPSEKLVHSARLSTASALARDFRLRRLD